MLTWPFPICMPCMKIGRNLQRSERFGWHHLAPSSGWTKWWIAIQIQRCITAPLIVSADYRGSALHLSITETCRNVVIQESHGPDPCLHHWELAGAPAWWVQIFPVDWIGAGQMWESVMWVYQHNYTATDTIRGLHTHSLTCFLIIEIVHLGSHSRTRGRAYSEAYWYEGPTHDIKLVAMTERVCKVMSSSSWGRWWVCNTVWITGHVGGLLKCSWWGKIKTGAINLNQSCNITDQHCPLLSDEATQYHPRCNDGTYSCYKCYSRAKR